MDDSVWLSGLVAALAVAVGCNDGPTNDPGADTHSRDGASSDTASPGSDTAPHPKDSSESDGSETDVGDTTESREAGPAADATDTSSSPDGTDADGDEDPCIGGGGCYADRICDPGEAPVASSRDELVGALAEATGGDIVYVAGDAEIDLGGTSLDPADGVTLASDRGCDGAPGGMLYSDAADGRLLVTDSDDVRVTGLRVAGKFRDQKGVNELYDGDGWDAGIRIGGENATVDNNEIYGFRYVGVDLENAGAHVHHNTIHYNAGDGLGYGIVSSTNARPMPLIEYNYFNYNRHSVVTHADRSYEVRYNVHGPDMPNHHVFDVHGTEDECGQHCGGTAGDEIRIHHNTVEAANDPMVSVRGVPNTGAWIESNWFYHDEEGAVIQEKQTSFDNVTVQGNHYGEDEPDSCDVGAPRPGCP